MTKFVDELPPSPRGGSGEIAEFAADLRANPGRWAVYPRRLAVTSLWGRRTQINNYRGLGQLETGEFEAEVRQGTLYVRFKVLA